MSQNRSPFLAAFSCLLLALAEPAPAQDSPLPAGPRVLGKVLILDSERCYAGEVEKIGEQYCVKQGSAEIWLPANKVLRVCPDWQGAYTYMKLRANLDDPDERLRLARWCQVNNLLIEALGEAQMAQDLRPLHTATRHLVGVLKERIEFNKTKPVVRPAVVEVIDRTPPLDVNLEASAHFVTRIQPILMNTCFSCHASGKGGDFQLYRPSEGGSAAAAQRNIKSVLTQVRFDNVAFSPILLKAATKHGAAASAPLPGKKSVPYQSLESWVKAVVATHPHLKEQLRPAETTRKTGEEKPGAFAEASATTSTPSPILEPKTEPVRTPGFVPVEKKETPPPVAGLVPEPTLPMPGPRATTPRTTPPGVPSTSVAAAPPAVREPDVYSPDDFNRVAHPKR